MRLGLSGFDTVPKFSDTEKENIKTDLMKHGFDLFSRFGLRKTSVEDITNSVKISKGSFYSFYETKEELFLDIFAEVNQRMQESIFHVFSESAKKPSKRLFDALQMQYDYVDKTPIFNILMDKNEMEYLLRKYPQAGPQLQSFFADESFVPFVEELKKGGVLKKSIDTSLIVGLLKAVFLLHQRKEDFLPDQFKEVFDIYLRLIVNHVAVE